MAISPLYPDSRPLRGYNFAKATSVSPELGFARASTGTYVGPDGLIHTATVGEPRFDHNPITGENKGLLIEGSATNLVTNSSFPTDRQLLGISSSTVSSILRPDGTTGDVRAFTVTDSAVSPFPFYRVGYSNTASNILHTGSVWIRAASGSHTISFGLSTAGGPAPAGNTTVTTSWKRLQYTRLPNGGFELFLDFYTLATVNGTTFYIWGAQIETGSSLTSYIPTTGSTVTRAADTLSPITLPTSNSSTVLIETESLANNIPILSLNDSTTTNEILLTTNPLAGGATLREQNSETLTTIVGGNRLYKSTAAISVDGNQVQVVNDGSATIATTTISSTNLNQINPSGTIKSLYVYPEPYSASVLKSLTTRGETTPFPPTTKPNLTLGVAIEAPNTTWNLRSAGTVDYDVDWGDGQIEVAQTSNTKEHTYVSPGIYKVVVTIRSGVWRPYYNNNIDAQRITYIVGTVEGWSFGTSLNAAWYGGGSIVFVDEELDTSIVTDFANAWRDCRSLLSFPLLDTSSGTSFYIAWSGCSSLTSFPLIDTSSGTSFYAAWQGCSSLTSFPLIDTPSGTDFRYAWRSCSSLTSFPLIDTSSGTSFYFTWYGCSSLTSFPLLDTSSSTSFYFAWSGCSSLTAFPLIDTPSGTNFQGTWQNCSSLTSFPLIDTSSGTDFTYTWQNCSSLTTFPLIDTSSGTNFSAAWDGCSSLTSFPLLDTSSGTTFSFAWRNCSSLTSFPLLDISSGTNFQEAWRNCSSLTSFPANIFDSCLATQFNNAFSGCALTAQSIENILVSIDTAGQSNGTLTLSGGTNATKSTWTTAANTAYDALIARGWTITFRA